jgi:hypothetical protein
MLRQVLIEMALFLAPFAVYAVALKLRGRAVTTAAGWQEAPLAGMALAGFLLVAAGLAVLVIVNDGSARNGVYVPTHFKDGQLVPGHFER